MFCPKCGANQPDGASFCDKCGSSLGAPKQTAPAQPATKLTKKQFIAQAADSQAKLMAKLTLVLTLVCLLVMMLGHVVLVNTSIEDIPVIASALGASGEDDTFDEAKDALGDALDDLEDEYEEYEDEIEDELSKSDLRQVEKMFKNLEACADSFSINNMRNLFKSVEKLSDTDLADYMDLEDSFEEFEMIVAVLDTVTTVMFVLSMLSVLFTLIGGPCRIRGLVIAGLVLSTLFALVVYGFLIVLLNAAAHAALIFVMSKVDKAYKDHCNGVQPAAI